MVTIKLDNQEFKSGTAWIAAYKNDYTYLITAGHVCDDSIKMENVGLVIQLMYTSKTFTLLDKDSNAYEAEFVAQQYDASDSTKGDLCLLRTKHFLGHPMLIAKQDIRYNERADYVGAPAGIYGSGLAPTFSGVYCGYNWFCIPTAPGASGSAFFTREGVVGVLTAVSSRFPQLSYMQSRKALLDFLAANKL